MKTLTSFTPHYAEDVTLSLAKLSEVGAESASLLATLQSLHPDEWQNLCERIELGGPAPTEGTKNPSPVKSRGGGGGEKKGSIPHVGSLSDSLSATMSSHWKTAGRASVTVSHLKKVAGVSVEEASKGERRNLRISAEQNQQKRIAERDEAAGDSRLARAAVGGIASEAQERR